MIIKIDDNCRVETDELNCILIAKRETVNPRTKEKGMKEHTLGYFSSLGSALKYLAKYEVRNMQGTCNIDEYIALCEKELDRLNAIVDRLSIPENR